MTNVRFKMSWYKPHKNFSKYVTLQLATLVSSITLIECVYTFSVMKFCNNVSLSELL
jgi:hypothetical protein